MNKIMAALCQPYVDLALALLISRDEDVSISRSYSVEFTLICELAVNDEILQMAQFGTWWQRT